MFTISELKGRSWTDALIRDLLGEPDATEPNLRYRRATSMKMYGEMRVRKAEMGYRFQAAAMRNAERRGRRA